MDREIMKQMNYWDKKVDEFDSIYSHDKSKFSTYLDSLLRWDIYKRFDYTMDNAEPIQNRTFLDVGCGTGRYSLELAHRNARKVVGIDISEMMIKTCRQRATKEQLDNKTLFIHADLLEYQSIDKFDVCIGIGLFDYIKEPLPVLNKMREIIRDRAIMSFPRFWTWRAPVRKIRLRLNQCYVHFYTKENVDYLLRQARFKSFDITVIGQLFCVTAVPE